MQRLVEETRARGTAINSSIPSGVGRGIVMKSNKSLLHEYGGPIQLSKEWAKLVLRMMGYTKRRANFKSKVLVDDFTRLKMQFLLDVKACVEFKDIPHELILNWDQTGLKIVPSTSWTMEKKGTKRVELVGIDDKRQITAVFVCSLAGDFLPLQVIYAGNTNGCLPKYSFPDEWHATYTPNHWANENTMEDYVNLIIILPYVQIKRMKLNLPADHPALVVFDVFKGQCTKSIDNILQANDILYVHVPANCKDKLQPLDFSESNTFSSPAGQSTVVIEIQ